jgi:prepilin-type N-terminal cleavage/methylation domain-containing protein
MRTKAFSLIELLMVMAVGLVLMVMAIPAFTKIARKSKVQQTAESLVVTFNNALLMSKQLCRPEAIVVYFGDDFSSVKTKPPVGVLPKYGNIEIWTAKHNTNGGPYYAAGGGVWPGPCWSPYVTPLEPMSVPLTFPEGVRIIAGVVPDPAIVGDAINHTYRYQFRFTNFNKNQKHCWKSVK